MTMENRHSFDDGVGEVHDDIDRAAEWNIDRVEPCRIGKRRAVLGVSEKMRLVYMKGMQLCTLVDDAPVLVSAGVHRSQGSCVGRILLAIDVEAVLVLSEGDDEIGSRGLGSCEVQWLVQRRTP